MVVKIHVLPIVTIFPPDIDLARQQLTAAALLTNVVELQLVRDLKAWERETLKEDRAG